MPAYRRGVDGEKRPPTSRTGRGPTPRAARFRPKRRQRSTGWKESAASIARCRGCVWPNSRRSVC